MSDSDFSRMIQITCAAHTFKFRACEDPSSILRFGVRALHKTSNKRLVKLCFGSETLMYSNFGQK